MSRIENDDSLLLCFNEIVIRFVDNVDVKTECNLFEMITL